MATALVLVPLALAIDLGLPTAAFAVLLGAIACLGLWEWSALAHWSVRLRWQFLLASVLVAIALMPAFQQPYFAGGVLLAALFWWLCALRWIVVYQRGGAGPVLGTIGMWLSGWMILVPAWFSLVYLHGTQPQGPVLVVVLFVLVWTADIAAYFAGRRWGRTQLANRVSPGKSREGLVGALLCTMLVATLVAAWFGRSLVDAAWILILCLGTVLFSVAGDLLESLFKRVAGVKDSGGLLPGHGGVLDRIDSLTAAAPVFTLGVLMLGGMT